MPDFASQMLDLFLNSGLAQYPDANVYHAATLLTPDERPTVPVTVANPDPKQYPVLRVLPTTEGMATRPDPGIVVFKGTQSYQDPALLAALLAHEGTHVKLGNQDEVAAYTETQNVLQRLGYLTTHPDYAKALQQRLADVKKNGPKTPYGK